MGEREYSLAVPASDAQGTYADLPGAVQKRVEDAGLIVHTRTRDKEGKVIVDHTLPKGWSSLPPKDLGPLIERIAFACEVINNLLTRARIEANAKDDYLRYTIARLKKSMSGTVSEREERVLMHEDYVQANIDWRVADGYRLILSELADTASRNWRVVSRHIEIRKEGLDAQHRLGNLDQKGPRGHFR